MFPSIGVSVGANHFRRGPRVTAICHLSGDFLVDGPAQLRVKDVTGNQPGDHEDAKGDSARRFILEILEDFGSL